MSTAVGFHSGSNPLSLMSCVRESSPSQELGSDMENEKNGKPYHFCNANQFPLPTLLVIIYYMRVVKNSHTN